MSNIIEEYKTIYGANIPPHLLNEYFNKLTGRIFKILPLSEEQFDTLHDYVKYLIVELNGGESLILNNLRFVELIIHLEALRLVIDDKKNFRSQVFKCVKLCKSIADDIKVGDANGI